MGSKRAAVTLIALLSGCTSSNQVSMDGVWRIEGQAESSAGQCEVMGDIRITGRTGERWQGAGRRTLAGQLGGIDVTRTDSVLFGINGLSYPGQVVPNFYPDVYVITRRAEPSVLAGAWWCGAQGPSGTLEATGHWVMRRITVEPVDGIL